MNKTLARHVKKAKEEGRVCKNCGWMITKVNWKKGRRLCPNCYDAMRGVNVKTGHPPYRDEPEEKTGNM